MNDRFHINEKLERQKLDDFFAERGSMDSKNTGAVDSLLNRIIGEIVMNTMFIAPVEISDDDDGSKNMTFHLVKDDEGKNFFPLFTNSERLGHWTDMTEESTVQLNFDDYASLLRNSPECKGFVVNPFTDNFRAEREVIMQWVKQKEALVKGYVTGEITDESKYELYTPEPYPAALSDKLCEAAGNTAGINRLWLRGITLEGAKGYLVVADFDGEKEKSFPVLGEAVRDQLGGFPLHIVPFDSQFGKDAVEGISPIYSKVN